MLVKLYSFGRVVITDSVGSVHTTLFHGEIDSEAIVSPRNFLGSEARSPLKVMRTGQDVPEVFEPGGTTLVVSDAVAKRLAPLPNLEQRPVAFTKLFDFPYRAGDFTCVENLRKLGGRFRERPWIETWEDRAEFHDLVRNVADFHLTIGTYHELIMARMRDIVGNYTHLKTFEFTPYSLTGEVTLGLSLDLLRDYPVFWNKAYFCTEESFAAFDPALDRDYYYVKCVDVDL